MAVRDEEESLPHFVRAVRALEIPEDIELHLVFVEDSSGDDTVSVLRDLADSDAAISFYSLAKSFGQGPAIVFGMSRSTADGIIMMDGDLSHPPEVIPEMLAGFLDGAQVVQCVRRSLANRSRLRDLGAASFRRGVALATGVDSQQQNVFFRLVTADVARNFLAHPRFWRFLRFPLPSLESGALRVVETDSVERIHGQSKYDFLRLSKVALDGLLSQLPAQRVMIFSVIIAIVGGAIWPVGALIIGAYAWIVWYWWSLDRVSPLEQMQVVESSP